MAAGTILFMRRPSPWNHGHDKQGYCLFNAHLENPGNNLTPVRYVENAIGCISKESAQQRDQHWPKRRHVWLWSYVAWTPFSNPTPQTLIIITSCPSFLHFSLDLNLPGLSCAISITSLCLCLSVSLSQPSPPFSLIDSFLHLPSSQFWITTYFEPGCQRSLGLGGKAREFRHTTLICEYSLSLTDVQKWNPR